MYTEYFYTHILFHAFYQAKTDIFFGHCIQISNIAQRQRKHADICIKYTSNPYSRNHN